MNDEKVELARRSAQAWSERDAEWFVDNCTPDFEFVPAVIGGVEGRQGAIRAEGIRRYFVELDEPWESFLFEDVEFREVDDQVVCLGRVHAKGRGSGVELDEPIAMVLWFRDGKLARARSILDHDEALAAAQSGKEGTA
jgi:ketosteroid isomerase-like protein